MKYTIGFVFSGIEIYPKQENTEISTSIDYEDVINLDLGVDLFSKLEKIILLRPKISAKSLSNFEKELLKDYKVPLEIRTVTETELYFPDN